ncbi:MAG: hypothetical protein RIE53_09810 [Rhodothermales bacterium]
MKPTTDEYDSPWKEALHEFFPEFLELLFPDLHKGVDWSRPIKFLDKELEKLYPGGNSRQRRVDKLVEVGLADGTTRLILIHVEVQSQMETAFAQRMYMYHYRLFDYYRQPVISLAVLADGSKRWRPTSFSYENFGCQLAFDFPTVKLMDIRDEPEPGGNPFAVIILAHNRTRETRRAAPERKAWKLAIIKGLLGAGGSQDLIAKLLRFVDWIMILPPDLEHELTREIAESLEVDHMPYITSWERMGIQRGREEGQLIMAKSSVVDALETRFGDVPDTVRARIEQLDDVATCKSLLTKAIRANSLAEFNDKLEESP